MNSRKIVLPFTPHKYQLEYHLTWKRWNLCICTRGFGKTVLALLELCTHAAEETEQMSYAYIAPKKGQAKDVTRDLIPEYLGPLLDSGIMVQRDGGMELLFPHSGTTIRFYGTDPPNDKIIRGNTFKGLVVDEFDDVRLDTWYNIIRPTLRKYKGWALLIGTIQPGGNLINFRDKYEADPEWNVATYTFSDTWEELPAYDADEKRRLELDYRDRPNEWLREYECDETATTEDSLIPAELIYRAKGKQIKEEVYFDLPLIFGVDVSTGEGQDPSVLIKRQGLACWEPERLMCDNMTLASHIAAAIEQLEPDAVFIDNGRGEGVKHRLLQLGFTNIYGVDFGGRPMCDIYQNKRTEMYFLITEWLRMGGVLPDHLALIQELLAGRTLPRLSEKFMMEPKHKIRERIGRSPDHADALALTFAAPVHGKMAAADSMQRRPSWVPPHMRKIGGNKPSPISAGAKRLRDRGARWL